MLSIFEVQQLQYNYTSRLNNTVFSYASSCKCLFLSMLFLSMTISCEEKLIQLKSNSHMVLVRVGQFFSWLELLLDSLSVN